MKNKKVLIIKLGAIGDVIHSTMLAQSKKKAEPNCIVHFMTTDFIVPLLENNPDIDKVISFRGKSANNYLYLIFKGLSLAFERYDIVFPLSNSIRNYIIMLFMFAKKITRRNKNRIHAVDAFYNTAVDSFGEIEKPKNLRIFIREDLKNEIKEKYKDLPRPWIIFNVGGANDHNRQGRIYPDEHWMELGKKLKEKYNGTIFVCGSKKEIELHEKFKPIAKVLTGKLTLEESAALYAVSDLFISGDSGPLHIASALNINTIGIMGSTPTYACGPYGEKGYVVEPKSDCKFCEKKVCKLLKEGEKFTPCMQSIEVCDILNLIKEENLL